MLPLIAEDVPEFLLQRNNIAFCNNLRLKTKSSLVLTKSLRFYEFRKKQLLHHINLSQSCLQQVSTQLQSYVGPISSFLIREDLANTSNEATCFSMLRAAEDLPLSLGKYVWLGEHVYILVRCWQQLVVLKHTTQQGENFELIEEYEKVLDYRLVKGPIKYQAYVELHFTNGKRKRTNFQLADGTIEPHAKPAPCSSSSFQRLVQRVNSARAELYTQRAQTQRDFLRTSELLAFGVPGERSPVLYEKQLLCRCGDIWTRICDDMLVIGTLLNNCAGCTNLTIVRSIKPLLRLVSSNAQQPVAGLNYAYRLYELPPQPDGSPPEDYTELAQFWACQEQQQHSWRNFDWRELTQSQLLPECSAVLVVRIRLANLLLLEQLQLFVLYELKNASGSCSSRQLYLASIDVAQLLQQRLVHLPSFGAHSMHQDFLAIVMTQTAHCSVRLEFQNCQGDTQFQELLVNSLGFELCQSQAMSADSTPDELMLDATRGELLLSSSIKEKSSKQLIFYNRQVMCQWCGILLLHDSCSSSWHIYARSESMLCLLMRFWLRDLMQLQCNIKLLQLNNDVDTPELAAVHLETALRQELLAWQQLLQQPKLEDNYRRLHQMQMASDLLVTVIKNQTKQTND